jgi:post-segregation antitoxin (ccd killing protein)
MVRSHTVRMKRNLTVQLDDEVIRRAKVLSAKRGTSVSGLVAAQLARLVGDERYEEAWRRARKAMGDAAGRGGRQWDREDLHGR